MKSKGEEVDYKTFVAMIEEGSVESVLVEDSRIEFTALNDEGEEAVFITGRMEDPALTERLLATNAKFTQEIIPEESPLLNFFLIWILPMVLLYAFWNFMMRRLQGRVGGLGGSEMKFGKSNVMVYTASETGKNICGRSRPGRSERSTLGSDRFSAQSPKIPGNRGEDAERDSACRTSGNRQNAACESCRGRSQSSVLFDIGVRIYGDVCRFRSSQGAGSVQSSPGQSPLHRLH